MSSGNDNSIIELLSSDDDETASILGPTDRREHDGRGVTSAASLDSKIASNSASNIANDGSTREFLIDDDDDDDDDGVILVANDNPTNPSASVTNKTTKNGVKNPYTKKRQQKSVQSTGDITTTRALVENPYKKKKQSADSKPSTSTILPDDKDEKKVTTNASRRAQSAKSTSQKPAKQSRKGNFKHPPENRELQAGLVFEEDIDHITHHKFKLPSDKKSLKQSSLKLKSFASTKNPPKSKLNFTTTENDNLSDWDNNTGSDSETAAASLHPPSAQAYAQYQYTTRIIHNLPPVLYHDPDFVAGNPAAVDGIHKINTAKKKDAATKNNGNTANSNGAATIDKKTISTISTAPPKCRCRPPKPCKLAYCSKEGPNFARPFHCCQSSSPGGGGGCNYFSWAFTSYMLHWYRFGSHNGHILVKPERGFRAEDLVQGKVGDCWFLSALAVVAEREDLIGRLIGDNNVIQDRSGWAGYNHDFANNVIDNFGVVTVTLFKDGYWERIVMDDFLPCIISQEKEKKEELEVRLAVEQSLMDAGLDPIPDIASRYLNSSDRGKTKIRTSSKFDPNSIADECLATLTEIHEFLHHDRWSKDPIYRSKSQSSHSGIEPLDRHVKTSDLAYSKAKHNQLWVQYIEKAYAKMHGSYKSISGGHVAEAFLDLTGAPTAVYNFDHHNFNPRSFWTDLMEYRKKRLPMGCGTSSSQQGLVGMHAYSILDVREIKNVGLEFFREKLVQGTHGNVSGFTDFDGTVRLMRIRNPHGQGEWKGEFSDKSPVWESLMRHKNFKNGVCDLTCPQSPDAQNLQRTNVDDGTFWISYDDFLLGFTNVDVVLAFQGNHAKSFASNFPHKKSNHRCARAFELSVVGRQPGEKEPVKDEVEVYILGIQKSRRGASHGRADRKKSYKASDLGLLVGECQSGASGEIEMSAVEGRFFGLKRNGHIRLVLNRSHPTRRLIVMPMSFGHPAATDEEMSFVLRFVADSPLLVQELKTPPKQNFAIQSAIFGHQRVMSLGMAGTSRHRGAQCTRRVLLESTCKGVSLFRVYQVDFLANGGGTVLLYLCVNNECLSRTDSSQQSNAISFSIEINCRGMVCRTANGLENHIVVSKGKKFEAAWRCFNVNFEKETQSRLLMAVVQSGEDYQIGSINCEMLTPSKISLAETNSLKKYALAEEDTGNEGLYSDYDDFGLFASVDLPMKSFPNESYSSGQLGERISLIGGDGYADNDTTLQIALQKSREEYEQRRTADSSNTSDAGMSVIDICDVDNDVNAAITASLNDQRNKCNANNAEQTFSDDIERAIQLSLNEEQIRIE